jgi:hypothetical protein
VIKNSSRRCILGTYRSLTGPQPKSNVQRVSQKNQNLWSWLGRRKSCGGSGNGC